MCDLALAFPCNDDDNARISMSISMNVRPCSGDCLVYQYWRYSGVREEMLSLDIITSMRAGFCRYKGTRNECKLVGWLYCAFLSTWVALCMLLGAMKPLAFFYCLSNLSLPSVYRIKATHQLCSDRVSSCKPSPMRVTRLPRVLH